MIFSPRMHALTVLLLGALFASFNVHAVTITLRADEWAPMNSKPGAENPGYLIELAQMIWGKAGHKIDYQIMPWERAISDTRAGKFDCIVGAFKKDAPDFVFPEVPLIRDDIGFFRLAGKPWQFNIDNLKPQKLAIIGGYSYDDGGPLDAYIADDQNTKALHISKGNEALEKNIRMLAAGRVDVAVESIAVFRSKLKELHLDANIVEADRLHQPKDIYIACSPHKVLSKMYTDLLGKGIADLRASGELQKLLQKYELEDWQ